LPVVERYLRDDVFKNRCEASAASFEVTGKAKVNVAHSPQSAAMA
jgi:hypothetical protein